MRATVPTPDFENFDESEKIIFKDLMCERISSNTNATGAFGFIPRANFTLGAPRFGRKEIANNSYQADGKPIKEIGGKIFTFSFVQLI